MILHLVPGKSFKTLVTFLLGCLLILTFPILNGGVFLYYDSISYIEQAAKVLNSILNVGESNQNVNALSLKVEKAFGEPEPDKVVFSGRSLYFGIFAYAGWASSLWVPVLAQAGILVYLVSLMFKLMTPQAWMLRSIVTLAFLGTFSSASLFTGLLMPDIWVGIMILAMALLWTFSEELLLRTKLLIGCIVLFSILAHASHLAILIALLIFVKILEFLNIIPKRDSVQKTLITAGVLAIGIAGMVAYNLAVTNLYKAKLLHRPFIAAHLIDMGPGASFLEENCPDSGFRLCKHNHKLPIHWIDFLFDQNPNSGMFASATLDDQLAIIQEQPAFILSVLQHDPIGTIWGLSRDGFTQLWTISIEGIALTVDQEGFVQSSAPSDIAENLSSSRLYNNPSVVFSWERQFEITRLISVVVLFVWLFLRLKNGNTGFRQENPYETVIIVLAAGILINGLVCGVLASPYGRFQARIVWLLPLIAVLVLTMHPFTFRKMAWPSRSRVDRLE